MANIKSAKKRARQAIKRRAHNMSLRSRFRTYLKKVESAIEAGDQSAARDALVSARPVIDSMVTKGIIHKNKAARHKGRLTKRVQAMS